jgi:hypothetical protein
MGIASVIVRRSASLRQGFWSEVTLSFVLIAEPDEPASVEKASG